MNRKKIIPLALFFVTAIIVAGAITLSSRKTTRKMTGKPTETEATANRSDAEVEFTTTEGNFTVRLFGDTPKHRDNFLKLVREGFYDGVLFHRSRPATPSQKTPPQARCSAQGDPATISMPKSYIRHTSTNAARLPPHVRVTR